MSGSNLVAVKTEFFRRLKAEPGLVTVQVEYAPPRDVKRELIYGGKARFNHDLMAMKGSQPRLQRNEQVSLIVVIQVRNLQSNAEAAEARVMELLLVIEEMLAADPRLSGFPGLMFAGVETGELNEPEFDDDGVTSVMPVGIAYRSHLS